MTFSTQRPSLSVDCRNFPANTLYQALGQCRPAKKAGERAVEKQKKAGRAKGRACKRLFKYLSPPTSEKKKRLSCQNDMLKCQNVPCRRVSHVYYVYSLSLRVYSQAISDLRTPPTTRSKLDIKSCRIMKKNSIFALQL